MSNRLYGEGPVLSWIHMPNSSGGVSAPLATKAVSMNGLWRVPISPFSVGIIVKQFLAYAADDAVGTTGTLTCDLLTGSTIAGATTSLLDATVDFSDEATAFMPGVLITTDALTSNPNIGGVPGTFVPAGNYLAINFAGTIADATHFERIICQVDYVPWQAQASLAPGATTGNV